MAVEIIGPTINATQPPSAQPQTDIFSEEAKASIDDLEPGDANFYPGCPMRGLSYIPSSEQQYEDQINYMTVEFTKGIDVTDRKVRNNFANTSKLQETFERAVTYKMMELKPDNKGELVDRESARKAVINDIKDRVKIANKGLEEELDKEYNNVKDSIASKIGYNLGHNRTLPFNNDDVEDDIRKLGYLYFQKYAGQMSADDLDYNIGSATEVLGEEIRNRIENHLKHHHLDKDLGLDRFDEYWNQNGKGDLRGILTESYASWINDGRPNRGGWSAGAVKDVLEGYFKTGHDGFDVSTDIALTAPCTAY